MYSVDNKMKGWQVKQKKARESMPVKGQYEYLHCLDIYIKGYVDVLTCNFMQNSLSENDFNQG